MDQEIRLVYAAASNQVRVNFSAELVRDDRKPPKDLYKRAKAKLEDEQAKGNIETFVIYENAFNQYWTHLREQEDLTDKNTAFCIAQGFRNYKDIQLKQGSNREWTLTVLASPEMVGKIGWPRFHAFVQKQMALEPYTSPVLQARILEAYWRAVRGEKIQNRALAALALDDEMPPLKFSHDKTSGTLMLWVNSIEMLQAAGHKKILTQIQAFLEKNKAAMPDYAGLNRECAEFLKELIAMPESFGYGLPLGLPVAVKNAAMSAGKKDASSAAAGKDVFKNTRAAATKPEKSAPSSDRLIEIEIAADHLEAHIIWANDTKLQSGPYDQDKKWLEAALQEVGICYGYEIYLDKILSLITLGQSIKNQVIARGLAARAGDQTYLHPLYLEKTVEETDNVIDLRSAQNKRVVETGDPIAEIRFRDGKTGTDVFGQALHATVKETSYTLSAGPGVEKRADGRFYALLRGMPKIERHLVSCLNVYVHRGDVNLKTGDINFDGTVEVKGNIDNGARVYAKGDLIVRGGIGRARIRCGGDLSVSKGIVTSKEGMVHAGGDVQALFVENSRILVEGVLEVDQSILNSDCKVAGEIVIKNVAKGLIGGGIVVSETGIRTQDLGFADGEKTLCRVGSDWRLEHRITILRGREAKLKRFVGERQYEFDDLAKKKATGDRIQKVEKRLTKGKKLLDKIEKLAELTRSKIRWNDMAILVVRGVMDPNVEITIGGRVVGVPKSLREVMFTAVRYRDQYVNSLIYLEQYKKTRTGEGDAV
ncbi:MAG TPA: FapA family protein [Oligoflexus sp.]|uniref:DUF342 domain-containing protein n=1 Tax=Oligoflexus sp. TaxID=1971216 RepID=UPI002D2302B8|nr:FapA family protein [Oligoflexus sp.]HYX31842.1 FapA family protein [Oligoflexus sp.]